MSRKKRERKERNRLEQHLIEIQNSQNLLAKRVLKAEPGEAKPVLIRDPQSVGMRKMSEILLEFADPFFKQASIEDYPKVLMFAITAWNLSLTNEASQKTELQKLSEAMGTEIDSPFFEDLLLLLEPMIKRKQDHYSEIRRLVMDWDYIPGPSGAHLNVVSTVIEHSLL
jgi:hypothetical protein